MRSLPLLFFLFLLSADTFGSTTTLFRSFNVENSDLPSNVIYRMFCDHYGYMWFATEDGLVKFNGRNFEKMEVPLNDQEIVNLYHQGDTLFLFNFPGQMAAIDLRHQRFIDTRGINAWLKKDIYSQPISVAGIIRDTLYLCDLRSMGACYSRIGSLVVCKAGRDYFWSKLRTHYKVSSHFPAPEEIYTEGTQRIHGLQFTNHSILYKHTVYNLKEDTIEEVFNGARHKLNGTLAAYARVRDDLYIAYHNIPGLLKFQGYFAPGATRRAPEVMMPGEKILSLVVDHTQNLWVSLYKGGLALFSPETEVIKHYHKKGNGLHEDYINHIQQDGPSVLVAYKDGRFDVIDSLGIRHLPIYIREGKNAVKAIVSGKHYWNIVTHSGITSFAVSTATGLPSSPAIRFQPVPVKDISVTSGLYYVGAKNKYYILTRDLLPRPGHLLLLPTMSVATLPGNKMAYGTLNGVYWDNTLVKGTENDRFNVLRYFDSGLLASSMKAVYIIRQGKIIRRYTREDGLLEGIYTDIQASRNFFYVLSESGISLIDRNTLQIAGVFSGKEFVTPMHINSFCLYRDSLTLGTDKGIFKMPETYLYARKPAPAIYIHPVAGKGCLPVLKGSEERDYSPNLMIYLQVDILDYKGSRIQASYSITRNGKVYIDKATLWGNVVRMDNPAPGSYIIKVLASSQQDRWQQTMLYTLTIRPLWYQTIFLKISLVVAGVLLSLFLSWLIYARRLKVIRRKIENRSRLAELNSQALFAQMKPHFIFNALNPLQSFILKNNKERALDYLEKFAALTRELLNQSRDKYSTLEGELRFIKNYVFITQTRFADNFTFDIKMGDDSDLDLLIPTMLLQPLVENAVDHGVKLMPHGTGMILIRIRHTIDALHILIADNGPGFSSPPFSKKNHALSIIMERLSLIKNELGTGDITICRNDETDTTEVSLKLPIIKNRKY